MTCFLILSTGPIEKNETISVIAKTKNIVCRTLELHRTLYDNYSIFGIIILSLFLQIENQKYSLLPFFEHFVCACNISAHVVCEERMRGLGMLSNLPTVTQAALARARARALICLALCHSALCLL